jgi:hypothetical protein
MMHILSSLPHFLAAILRYWMTVLTGSAIAVGLWAFEHYLGRTITWGWCIGIALSSLFISCPRVDR